MEFVNCLEKAFDFVAGFGEVFGQNCDGLLPAVDLRLQVFDCAVDVADLTGLRVASLLEVFELLFKL